MTVARAADLWDQIGPEVLRQMVAVFAAAGQGVEIAPVPETESSKWEEDANAGSDRRMQTPV